LRKVFFAVVLVAASFAGGAVVNGPGLRWAQTMILSRLHPEGDDEGGLEVDSESSGGDPAPAEIIPSKPVPPLFVGPTPADSSVKKVDTSKDATSASAPVSKTSNATATALPARTPEPKAEAPDPKAPPAPVANRAAAPEAKPVGFSDEPVDSKSVADAGVRLAQASTADDRPLPLDPSGSESSPSEEPAVKPGPIPSENDTNDTKGAEPKASDTPRSDAPAAGRVGATENPAQSTSSITGWAEVRRKLAELGVSRYGIEGEPKGRVRFHCIIPLAGRRAVAQHFEAEGNDELQAAELTLRRIALWRATESTRP